MNRNHLDTAPMDDATIVRGLRRGDRAAWAAVYDTYSVRIWRYVARMVGANSAAVADVVQETFLSAARSALQFDSDRGTLWTWLAGIAHNQVLSHWRQAARQERAATLAAAQAGLVGWWTRGEADPLASLDAAETSELVRLILTRLPADYANLLTARYIDQLSLAEMQNLFGSTVEALRSRLHRARGEFRTSFERISAGAPGEHSSRRTP